MIKAITIKQPWAWAIAHGGKDVENRTWGTSHTGLLAIHAGAAWAKEGAYDRQVIAAAQASKDEKSCYDPPLHVEIEVGSGRASRVRPTDPRYIRSAIVAVAEVENMGVCEGYCSLWAIPGQHHWRLTNVRPLAQPVPCKGRLGLWNLPDAVETAVHDQLAAEPEAAL
ncbi:hypothetical protein ACLQ2R_17500 [Streptosporangium sp. DT93]|uniref:hypothetical protein n=1 Tax=Streptosporangium sp. DT93 TaxID=3393428 RepID=UPI003CE80A07